jgi:GDP-4-dehydro-6-deoxy-D-mannose reductase
LRRAGVTARVLVTASATVYAPSDQPIAEDGSIAPGSPYGLSKLAQEMRSLRACRRGPARRDRRARLQPHRAASDAGVRRAEFRAPDRVDGTGRAAARDSCRQPHTARDLSDVRDVVRAYAALMARGASGAIYNVASGIGRPIQAILDALVSRARVAVTVETDPRYCGPTTPPRSSATAAACTATPAGARTSGRGDVGRLLETGGQLPDRSMASSLKQYRLRGAPGSQAEERAYWA